MEKSKSNSNICYEFIDTNKEIFDKLKEYNVDHEFNRDLFIKYIDSQKCSTKYFNLIKYLYENHTYISYDMALKQFTDNISELEEKYNDKELIVVFIQKESHKSNYYFTLYFLYLYRKLTGKKIEYVFFEEKNSMDGFENPLLILCDDFIYSGNQITQNIKKLFLSSCVKKKLQLFLHIIGRTEISSQKLDSIENVEIIYPEKVFIEKKTILSLLSDKINENEKKSDFHLDKDGSLSTDDQKMIEDYIIDNDMYILNVDQDKLYVTGQLYNSFEYFGLSLIYLFFKYPDNLSTITTMCGIKDYKNVYTINYDTFTKKISKDKIAQIGIGKFKWYYKFEITPEMIDTNDLNDIKNKIISSEKMDISKYDWIEECINFEEINDNLKKLTFKKSYSYDAKPFKNIELINNCEEKIDVDSMGLCNQSIKPFYKSKPFVTKLKSFYEKNIRYIGGKTRKNRRKRRKTRKIKNMAGKIIKTK